MFKYFLSLYGVEYKHSNLLNTKGKIIYGVYGETYPGYLSRYFVDRRFFKGYKRSEDLKIPELGSSCGEQVAAFLRRQEPSFEDGPLVIARRPS